MEQQQLALAPAVRSESVFICRLRIPKSNLKTKAALNSDICYNVQQLQTRLFLLYSRTYFIFRFD